MWAVYGPTTRRIGEVKPAGGSTACWWAITRAGGIQGRGSTFGAAVGLLVDAALEARTDPARGAEQGLCEAPRRAVRAKDEDPN